MEIRSVDGIMGINGPGGECTCDHCQMDHNIDSIMAEQEDNYDEQSESQDSYATPTVAVVTQMGE